MADSTRPMTVGIIGGGAAGLMAAATFLERSVQNNIFLFETNPVLGEKILRSGGGRCNVTTGVQNVGDILKRYPRGGKFLTSALHAFPPSSVCAWFETHGVPLKTERDLRVFPTSNDGTDIVNVFECLFRENPRMHLFLHHSVTHVERIDGAFQLSFKNTLPIKVDVLVLTTGGQASRHSGSTSDGYAFAETLGHTITPLAPSLFSFRTQESWPEELAGRSFESATITVNGSGRKKQTITGPFLFTHQGVSGPAVFAVSSLIAFEPFDRAHPLLLSIDLFPDQSPSALDQILYQLLLDEPKRSLVNVLDHLLPKILAIHACRETAVEPKTHAAEVSKKERRRICSWLKAIPLHIVGRGAGDEFVTAGGIQTDEVCPHSMESLLCPRLYFAGEILDIDGFTGGFNLQAAWATGRLAGEYISRLMSKMSDLPRESLSQSP